MILSWLIVIISNPKNYYMKRLYTINGIHDHIPETMSVVIRRRFIREQKNIDVCADDKGKLYLSLNPNSYDVQNIYVPIEQDDHPCIFFQKVDLYTEQTQFLKAVVDGSKANFNILKNNIIKYMPYDECIYKALVNSIWGYCDIATTELHGVFCNAKLVTKKPQSQPSYPVGEYIFGGAIEHSLGYLIHSPNDIFI